MTTISQMMDILLAELIAELRQRDRLDGICAQSLQPGATVSLDYGSESCGGMAWVQLSNAAPTVAFPDPDLSLSNCTYSLAYTVTMGIIRPSPIPTVVRNSISFPTDEENTDAAHMFMEDMDMMHQAIKSARKDVDLLVLGQYMPVGPEGGVSGGTWTLQVGNEDPD